MGLRAPACYAPRMLLVRLRLLSPLLALAVACGSAPATTPSSPPAPTTAAPAVPAPAPAAAPSNVPAFPPEWAHRQTAVTAQRGMVATDAALATKVGAEVLAQGGNAVDAAVAVAFALEVVYPVAGNIGGGGFIVAHVRGETAALDFRETAPAAATADMYLGGDGNPVTERSLTGHLAAGVPGAVAGLYEAHKKYGTKPWAELVAPAIKLAREGFHVDPAFVDAIARNADRLNQFPASAALFLPGGAPPKTGDLWRSEDLAKTLERIAKSGPDGFYKGVTAELTAKEMKRGKGLITLKDLAGYRAKWRTPLRFQYRGKQIVSMPPPSSGGITLAILAGILERYELNKETWHSTRELHLTAEAMRRAFAARNSALGDPDFVDVPLGRLTSREWLDSQAATINERATPSATISTGLGDDGKDKKHTTHFSVVDGNGDAVALTTTLNTGFGSAVVVEGAGYLLNNEMDDFTAKPGSPNVFGLVQGASNAIAPGKRMLSSMSPTIVFDDAGKPLLVTGASGGPTIITATWQIVSNVLDHGMLLGDAVSAPRIHHQHLPDALTVEKNGLTPETRAALEALGHTLRDGGWRIGDAPSILRGQDGWQGMAEPRQPGGLAAGP